LHHVDSNHTTNVSAYKPDVLVSKNIMGEFVEIATVSDEVVIITV